MGAFLLVMYRRRGICVYLTKAYDTTKFRGKGALVLEIRHDATFYVQCSDTDAAFPPDHLVVRRLARWQADLDLKVMRSCNSRKQVLAYARQQNACAPVDLARCTNPETLAQHALWTGTDDLLSMEPAFTRLAPPSSHSEGADWGTLFHQLGVVLPTDRCSPHAEENFFALLLHWKDPRRFPLPDTPFCQAISFTDLPTTSIGLAQWLLCKQAAADPQPLIDNRRRFLQLEATNSVDWHSLAPVLQRTFKKDLPAGLHALPCFEAVLSWVAPALYPPRAFGADAEEQICERLSATEDTEQLTLELSTFAAASLRHAFKSCGLTGIPGRASRADMVSCCLFCRPDMLEGDGCFEISFKVACAVRDVSAWVSRHDALPANIKHTQTASAREQHSTYGKLRFLRLARSYDRLTPQETLWTEAKLGKQCWSRDDPCKRFHPGSFLHGTTSHRHEYLPDSGDKVECLQPVSCYLCGASFSSFDDLLAHVKDTYAIVDQGPGTHCEDSYVSITFVLRPNKRVSKAFE